MVQEFKYIVRMAGRDLDGSKKVAAALADIKGVGYRLAQQIIIVLRLEPGSRLGSLSDQQLSELGAVLADPAKAGIPSWSRNRRKERLTGEDRHIIASDLELAVRSDISREKSGLSWKGLRHAYGLKVRGQRTRTTGRKGASVGVRKAAAGPATSHGRSEEA